mmetsp:Transcript_43285/g.50703  ORF Transcript_43285/g.50703 Transcript_43285/m.50703 type:complete len:132 (-) Transcript_43285:420-815(-)
MDDDSAATSINKQWHTYERNSGYWLMPPLPISTPLPIFTVDGPRADHAAKLYLSPNTNTDLDMIPNDPSMSGINGRRPSFWFCQRAFPRNQPPNATNTNTIFPCQTNDISATTTSQTVVATNPMPCTPMLL